MTKQLKGEAKTDLQEFIDMYNENIKLNKIVDDYRTKYSQMQRMLAVQLIRLINVLTTPQLDAKLGHGKELNQYRSAEFYYELFKRIGSHPDEPLQMVDMNLDGRNITLLTIKDETIK